MSRLPANKTFETEQSLGYRAEEKLDTEQTERARSEFSIKGIGWRLIYSKMRSTLKATVKYLLLILMCLVLLKELVFAKQGDAEHNRAVDLIFTELVNLLATEPSIGALAEARNDKPGGNFTRQGAKGSSNYRSATGQNLF